MAVKIVEFLFTIFCSVLHKNDSNNNQGDVQNLTPIENKEGKNNGSSSVAFVTGWKSTDKQLRLRVKYWRYKKRQAAVESPGCMHHEGLSYISMGGRTKTRSHFKESKDTGGGRQKIR